MNTLFSWAVFILVCLVAVDAMVRILIYIDRKRESDSLLLYLPLLIILSPRGWLWRVVSIALSLLCIYAYWGGRLR